MTRADDGRIRHLLITETPMYAYQAALYCDRCVRDIRARLDHEYLDACLAYERAHPGREFETDAEYPSDPAESGDTDTYPQWCDEETAETDSPNHCDAGDQCRAAEQYDGRMVGAYLRQPLTADGRAYVRQRLLDQPESELVREWAEQAEMRYGYTVRAASSCGMVWDIDDRIESRREAQQVAREYICQIVARERWTNPRYTITGNGHGTCWELPEPEGAAMVPDWCGTVTISFTVGR